jgi:hypothetical protein
MPLSARRYFGEGIVMNEVLNRVGASAFLTPREVIRDFVSLLNILYQNPNESFASLLGTAEFSTGKPILDPEALTETSEIRDEEEDSPYSGFKL